MNSYLVVGAAYGLDAAGSIGSRPRRIPAAFSALALAGLGLYSRKEFEDYYHNLRALEPEIAIADISKLAIKLRPEFCILGTRATL